MRRGPPSCDERPWLSQYPPELPVTLPLPTTSALDVFARQATAHPERLFVQTEEETYTYGRIAEMAAGLAGALQARGVRPGDQVSLCLQNVPAFPVALYAIWMCGAICVPLSPILRTAEMAGQLRDAECHTLICLHTLLAEAGAAAQQAGVRRVIAVAGEKGGGPPAGMDDFGALCRERAGRQESLSPDDIAYLVYTSGTTGPAKGAMISHGNVVYAGQVYREWARLGPEDVALGGAPLFHITGLIWYLAAAAEAGGALSLPFRFEPGRVLALQRRVPATYTCLPITAYISLLHHPDLRDGDLSSLTKAYSGGAPVPPTVVEEVLEATGVQIYPAYGMTETTSAAIDAPLGSCPPIDPVFGTLAAGIPVPGMNCRIVDLETGKDLPAGSPGELLMKGPNIVGGYWRKPDETAHALQDGWLRSGDVCVMNETGWFSVVDRVKDMIIASGYKVWPREVEDVLFGHGAVREAAVVGVPDAYRGESVEAYVSLRPGMQVTPAVLIGYCREHLAAYKAPRVVHIVDEIPRTASGKLARRLLRER